VEEIFGQLWAVPKPDKVRVPEPNREWGCLVWIRKDLVRKKKIRVEDCFPVNRAQRIEGSSTRVSFSRDILVQGKATYADILRRSSMAEGGRWVWQADKPPRAPARGGFATQRGRGAGQQYQGRPAAPPHQHHGRPPAPPQHHGRPPAPSQHQTAPVQNNHSLNDPLQDRQKDSQVKNHTPPQRLRWLRLTLGIGA
jgi:hypothetical protein